MKGDGPGLSEKLPPPRKNAHPLSELLYKQTFIRHRIALYLSLIIDNAS